MAATNLSDLHNFKQHFELAAQQGLLALQGETCYISRQFADPDVSLPEEMLSVILANTESVQVRGAGRYGQEWAGYQANLIFMVRTDRDGDAYVPAEVIQTRHAEVLAKVRAAMLYSSEIFGAGRLPLYDVVEVKPEQEVWDSDAEVRVDQTTLPYAIQFIIRQDAWPADDFSDDFSEDFS